MAERRVVFLKPSRPELIVRDPTAQMLPLPPGGKNVRLDSYWARRLRVGDVVEAQPERPAAKRVIRRPRAGTTEESSG